MSKEEMRISGDEILSLIRQLFRGGIARRVTFKDTKSKKAFHINLLLFVILALVLPFLIFIGILFLIATNYSIGVEKK